MSYDIPGVSMKSVSNTSRGGSQRGAGSVVMCVENHAPRKAFVTIPEDGHFAVFMKRTPFSTSSSRESFPRLRQPGVFRPCFVDHRDCRVGVLPQRKEIVVGAFRLHGVARERERSCQLQARHGVHGVGEHDTSVIENPLELGGGLCGLMRRK